MRRQALTQREESGPEDSSSLQTSKTSFKITSTYHETPRTLHLSPWPNGQLTSGEWGGRAPGVGGETSWNESRQSPTPKYSGFLGRVGSTLQASLALIFWLLWA